MGNSLLLELLILHKILVLQEFLFFLEDAMLVSLLSISYRVLVHLAHTTFAIIVVVTIIMLLVGQPVLKLFVSYDLFHVAYFLL